MAIAIKGSNNFINQFSYTFTFISVVELTKAFILQVSFFVNFPSAISWSIYEKFLSVPWISYISFWFPQDLTRGSLSSLWIVQSGTAFILFYFCQL